MHTYVLFNKCKKCQCKNETVGLVEEMIDDIYFTLRIYQLGYSSVSKLLKNFVLKLVMS